VDGKQAIASTSTAEEVCLMHETFRRWQEIGGLVRESGCFALVDRMALREYTNVGSLQRWQVIDESQEWYRTFRSAAQAATCLEDQT